MAWTKKLFDIEQITFFIFQLTLNFKAVSLSLTSIPKYIIDMQNNTKNDTENVLRR